MDRTGWDEALRRIEAERQARTGELDLSYLGLREVPSGVFELRWLRGLALGGSRISGSLAYNWLEEVPGEIRQLSHLNWLALDLNSIRDLQPLSSLRKLRALSLSRTAVVDLRPLVQLRGLQVLNCSYTAVRKLEPLTSMRQLRELHVSSSKVSELGPIRGISALQLLDVSGTSIEDIGPVAHLHHLRALNCVQTRIRDLEPLRGAQQLRRLAFGHSRVSSLGPLSTLQFLELLEFAQSDVTDLSPLSGLRRVAELKFSGTYVQSLAPLRDWESLLYLDCGGSWARDLCSIENSRNLVKLDCAHSPIENIDPVARFPRLESLNLSNTKVSDLGPLRYSTKLRKVSCDFTGVSDLAPLAKLSRLQTLSAAGCPVTALPASLIQQPSLQRLVLTSAPDCPAELLSQRNSENCLPRLRAHLADLQAGAEPQRTTKIIVLGNGRVGKTQLCRKLRGLPYDPAVSSTHGIVIDTADFPDDETLNLWDFGGQDIYHGAHALFMRTRAVFVIAWHPDFESTPYHEHGGLRFRNRPLAYWLAFVRAMGKPGSPIIIVQTRCDTRSDAAKSLPLSDDALDGLDVTSIAYSAKTGRGRRRLDVEIEQAIEDLRARDGLASIGVGRARVIERLRDLREADQERPPDQRTHRVLDMATFEAICAEAGDVSSPPALLDYLHQCGLVFYDPGRFAGRILLDLSWALDAVYSVFDRGRTWRQLHGTGGRFTRETLAATVWGDAAVDEQRLFLHLMLSCGICFQHGEGRQGEEPEYVAPDLLPERAAIAHHLDCRMNGPARRLVQRYDFLHPGLFRGLMARIGGKAGKAGVYWRHGLWVYVPRSRTQVQVEEIADAEGYGGRVEITMIGDDAELADWLRSQLAEQSRRFGSMCLAPETDELPSRRHPRADVEPGVDPDARAPDFGEMSAEQYAPPSRPRVYVSYAWKGGLDPAIVGQSQRGQELAHGLVEALRAHGVDVHVDRDDIALGDRISAFVQRLVAGDHIFVVISERYLASPWCMAELHGLWTHSRHHGDDFLRRVTPLVLEGTALGHPRNRRKYALHWKTEHAELERMLRESPDLMGEADMRVYRATGEYYRHVSDMLALLNDKLMPRGCDLEALAAEGFAPLLALLDPPAG